MYYDVEFYNDGKQLLSREVIADYPEEAVYLSVYGIKYHSIDIVYDTIIVYQRDARSHYHYDKPVLKLLKEN